MKTGYLYTHWQIDYVEALVQQPINTLRGGEKKDFGESTPERPSVKGGSLKESMKAL